MIFFEIIRSSVYLPLLRSFTIIIFINSPFTIHAQNSVLNRFAALPDTTCTLEFALNLIEKQTGYYFSYNPDIILVSKNITLVSPGDTLIAVLKRIIDDPDIQYKIIGDQIVIYDIQDLQPEQVTTPVVTTVPVLTAKGIIKDGNTRLPVPFATIGLSGTRTGTISNSEGIFVFKYPKIFNRDSVVLSCLGYKMKKICLSDLDTGYSEINLQPDYIPIQEVIIRKTDPLYLIRSAIAKIQDNYYTGSINQTTFYRESIKKGNSFVIISEAVLNIFRSGFYDKYPVDQVMVLKGRNNIDIRKTDTVTLKLKAGLRTSLMLDIVRNRPEFLNEDFFPYYTFNMTDIIPDEDRYTYVITFKQNEYTEPPHYEGRIYIDMESLAIRALEFRINPATIHKATKYLVIRKPRYLNVRPISAEYYVRYRQEQDKLYLAHIISDNKFRIKNEDQFVGSIFSTHIEMAITRTETENVNMFKLKETTNIDDPFIEHIGGYDESFWGEYNFIKPDEPLEDALRRINKLMTKP